MHNDANLGEEIAARCRFMTDYVLSCVRTNARAMSDEEERERYADFMAKEARLMWDAIVLEARR